MIKCYDKQTLDLLIAYYNTTVLLSVGGGGQVKVCVFVFIKRYIILEQYQNKNI